MFKRRSLFLLSLFFISGLSAEDQSASHFSFLDHLSEEAFHLGTGAALQSLSLIAQAATQFNHLADGSPSVAKECFFLQDLAGKSASYLIQKTSEKKNPHESWLLFQQELSQIPASSKEEQKLLHFLENRWLAKSTGFFPLLVEKVYPCFGVSVQVHPQTSTSYARSPFVKISKTYKKQVEEWKKVLPQPYEFPLVLTTPSDLKPYFLRYFTLHQIEDLGDLLKALHSPSEENSPFIVDFTSLLTESDPKKWKSLWKNYRHQLTLQLEKQKISLEKVLCIQRVQEEGVGGIRILPLLYTSPKKLEEQHRFLIEWISTFGLSANRVELDRLDFTFPSKKKETASLKKRQSKSELISALHRFESTLPLSHSQKNLMLQGSLFVLKELLESKSWEKVSQNPTLLSIAELSFFKIEKELTQLMEEKETSSFFDFVSHIEQIHANLSSLLEVLSPYQYEDFSKIYQQTLTSLPKDLSSHLSCGIHSSGMTSFAGILQATRKMTGKAPKVLYGENTYYECVNAASLLAQVSPLYSAEEKDFKEVDLIVAQFNPAWKGTHARAEYKEEKIAETLKKTFSLREGKPLVLAVDCTFDFINSPKVEGLLSEFKKEIKDGLLNVICYRSGLKFDLFGMDNYSGAPFYMVKNKDSHWSFFEDLLKDPVLQTDRLSLNWFCAAYKNASPCLEEYRREFFENTKKLLQKIPSRLFEEKAPYRVIPFSPQADPAFIDITLKGSLHQFKAAVLSGYLTFKCMEKGFPLFYRISIGFYHSNLSMLFGEDCSTIRLAVGLDPAQIDILKECFEMVDFLSEESFLEPAQILKSTGLLVD